MNKAAVAELRSLREKRERDPRRLLPAPDQLSEIITQSISDCVKNKMRFQVTRSKTFRKRFEGKNEAVKKLLKAHQLKLMDSLSDPYVKFKCGGRLVYKSRTVYRDLNPVWDESFTIPIEDPFIPISIKVFDYDWGLQDDFMGSAILDLATLDLARPIDLSLALQDSSRPEAQLGEIFLAVTLYPKSQEDKEQVSE
ncbi:hypothetical protein JTB14_030632 [Gonioctena quinquepunctata]|nr:hypothetical protein JTB14_030632 [Gonioctena quinquepunctata]